VDTKGNRSEQSDIQVTVMVPVVDKQTSTFTSMGSELPADVKSTQVLTLTLQDESHQAADVDVNEIGLKVSEMKSATVSALTRESAGVYTLTVTAGTNNETVTLKPSVRGVKISPASLVITSIIPEAGQSLFTASPETILADGVASSTLTLIAKNSRGKPLTGL